MLQTLPSILAATLLFPAQSTAPAATAVEMPNFTGSWQLNHQLSENPADKLREAMGSRPGGFGGGPGGGPGGGGPGGEGRPGGGGPGGWGGRPGEDGGGMRERMEHREAAAERLTVDHREPRLAVTDGNGERWQATVGGSPETLEGRDGSAEIAAVWKSGGRLVIRRNGGRNGGRESDRTATETWELVADGKRILVQVELGGGGPRPKISFTRVYDRLAADPAATAPPPSQR